MTFEFLDNQKPPKRIYLQQYFDYSDEMVTWCVDKINDEDIEYILQSEYDQLKTESERLQVDNTELKSLLLWAFEHINIPFHLFDENDQRNIWYNRVMEVTK